MSQIKSIFNQLATVNHDNQKSPPPIESWNPPYCGEIDIQIKADGSWFHQGDVFTRMALVKLFSSVLICEKNTDASNGEVLHEHFLITPVEKMKITVDDAPFVLIQWQWLDEKQQTMEVMTNIGDRFILNNQHKLFVINNNFYVEVRNNLLAKVHRNVFYQWSDIVQEVQTEQGSEYVFFSAGCRFSLGLAE